MDCRQEEHTEEEDRSQASDLSISSDHHWIRKNLNVLQSERSKCWSNSISEFWISRFQISGDGNVKVLYNTNAKIMKCRIAK
jgi:hypothetical protein